MISNKFAQIFHKNVNFNKLYLILLILLFSILGLNKIEYPGFYYDELLYANGLYNCYVPNLFNTLSITIQDKCINVLPMGYIGSLKTIFLLPAKPFINDYPYLAYRIIGILIAACSILVLNQILIELKANKSTLFVTLLLYSTQASFILGSKYDWGPSALSILLKAFLVLFAIRLRNSYNLKNWTIVIGISLISLFNKLDFVFYLIPLLTVLILNKESINYLLKYKNRIIAILLSTIPFGITLLYIIKDKISLFFNSDSISAISIGQKIDNLMQVLDGTSVVNMISTIDINNNLGRLYIICLAIATLVSFVFYRKDKLNNSEYVLLISSALYILFMFMFPKSGGIHHFIATFPIPFIALTVLLNKGKNSYIRYFIIIIALLFSFTQIDIINKTNYLMQKDLVIKTWSKDVDILANYLANNFTDKEIIVTDWGIANQLIVLSNGSLNIKESFRPISKLNNPQSINNMKNYDTSNTIAIRYMDMAVLEQSTNNFPYNKYQNVSKIGNKSTYLIYW